jgi:DNA-binding transcriptional regulator YhcF (GntR family)
LYEQVVDQVVLQVVVLLDQQLPVVEELEDQTQVELEVQER